MRPTPLHVAAALPTPKRRPPAPAICRAAAGALSHRPCAAPVQHQLPPPGDRRCAPAPMGTPSWSIAGCTTGACTCLHPVAVALPGCRTVPCLPAPLPNPALLPLIPMPCFRHARAAGGAVPHPRRPPAAGGRHERPGHAALAALAAGGTAGAHSIQPPHASACAHAQCGWVLAVRRSCAPAPALPHMHALPSPAWQVVLRYDCGRGPVTALAVSPEGCFLAGGWRVAPERSCRLQLSCFLVKAGLRVLTHSSNLSCLPLFWPAGTAEGSVVLFAPDPRRRITTRFNLAT